MTFRARRRVVGKDECAASRRVMRAYHRREAAGDIEAVGDMTAVADEIGTAI